MSDTQTYFKQALDYHLKGYVAEVVQPLGNALINTVVHPIDTLSNLGESALTLAKQNPYTCATIIGLGAFAYYKGWIKVRDNTVSANVNINTTYFGFRMNPFMRIGRR